jgi:nitrogen regulatory protein P-II 2
MKLVLAIIKPHKLDEVREALGGIDVQGLTITEARGYGRQKGHTEIYRGAEYETSLVPKLRLEVVVTDDYADRVVETIEGAARTDSIGDGKIFVIDVERAVRIRTGDQNNDAL